MASIVRGADVDPRGASIEDQSGTGSGRVDADVRARDIAPARSAIPPVEGISEAVLERCFREIELRLAEQTRVLAEAAHELSAEIARREEAQNALLQARKLETLGFLTGGIVHDFNNVLQAIQGNFEMLALNNVSPGHQQFIDNGQRAVERAKALSRRLLTFVRREEKHPEVLGARELLANLPELIRSALNRAVAREIIVDADVAPVIVDRLEFETVLLNLVVNARDAMPDGGRLIVAARNSSPADTALANLVAGDYVVFSVSDTGKGMPPDVVARAIEAFFTTKDAERGTGLGLAMASNFAKRASGALYIKSVLGKGTVVEIFLPRAASGTSETIAVRNEAQIGRVVLLADENEGARAVIARTLRGLGYQVVEASNVAVALALSYGMPTIHLAVASASLPDRDGLIDRLHIERPKLPVLLLVDQATAGVRAGISTLKRPFNNAELAAVVGACLADRVSFEERESALSIRMMARLSDPELKERFTVWRRLRGCDPLPRIEDASTLIARHYAYHFIAEADDATSDPPRVRYVSMGSDLTELLGRSLDGQYFADRDADVVGALPAAYAGTMKTRLPVYDWLSCSLGRAPPTRFERLIFPMSQDGHSVSHLIGFVRIDHFPGTEISVEL